MKRPDFEGINPEVAEYITSLENRIDDITQMLQNLQRLYFGKKSESIRLPAMDSKLEQLSLFEQNKSVGASGTSGPQMSAENTPDTPETIAVTGHQRKKKRTQEEIIADLPVIIHEHHIPPQELHCPRCGNEKPEYIGRELVYTEYVRVPAHIDRHEHYADKYACHACEDGMPACATCEHANTEACAVCPNKPGMVVLSAKLPEEYRYPLLKGSKASPSIVSQIYYDKFELALPEYRQEKEWERLGFPLSRQTMSNWILRIDKEYLSTLTAYMLKKLKAESSVVNCDETPVKVLDEKTDKGNVRKCHMWVVRSGKHETKQMVVFNYRASRSGDVATDILSGYDRYFVSDGYAGYNSLGKGAIRCGCWAHLRRKLYDSIPDHDMTRPSTGRTGVQYIDRLFRIEERLENVASEERLRIRLSESRPIADEFYSWLDTLQPGYKVLKDAVDYARNQKKALLRFLEDGRIPLSNNAAENAIRPFVVGRKNWLFCKSNAGAVAAANAYSIVETAKANGLDTLKYLNYILRHIPIAKENRSDEFLESLMPWSIPVAMECSRGCI